MKSTTQGSSEMPWRSRFLTIWTGQQLSLVGTRAAQFALVWWLTTETGSATVLATASMAALIPGIVLGPFIGALVDRWNRRIVMLAADTFIALVSLWLAYHFWTGTMRVWYVYVVMIARSLGSSFHLPAMRASTTLMVPRRHLDRVNGLNQMAYGLLTIVSPPLGALLIALLALHHVMMVDVGTALFAVVPLLLLSIPQPSPVHVQSIRAVSPFANAWSGLHFVLHWPRLSTLLGLVFVLKLAIIPAFSLVPLLVYEYFGRGARELSYYQAIAGIGTLVGGFILSACGGFKRKVSTILMGIAGLGTSTALLGFVPAEFFWLAMIAALGIGIMLSMMDGPITAVLQATIPAHLQGRVFGLLGSLVSLSSPIGLAMAGPISDRLGIRFWFQLGGLLCIVLSAIGFLLPRLIDIENQSAESIESLDSECTQGWSDSQQIDNILDR